MTTTPQSSPAKPDRHAEQEDPPTAEDRHANAAAEPNPELEQKPEQEPESEQEPEPESASQVAADPAPTDEPADAFEQELAVYPLREKAADPRWAVRLVWAWTGFALFSLAFVLALLVLGLFYD